MHQPSHGQGSRWHSDSINIPGYVSEPSVRCPIHREGWLAIGIFVGLTALLFVVAGPVGWGGVPLTAWCIWFFRDPERVAPAGNGLVVSPGNVPPTVEIRSAGIAG